MRREAGWVVDLRRSNETCFAASSGSWTTERSGKIFRIALFDFMLTVETPPRVIGDKVFDSDELADQLAEQGVELIAPHRSNRKPENKDAGWPAVAKIQTSLDGGTHHCVVPTFPTTVHSMGEVDTTVQRISSSRLHHPAA